MWFDFKRQLMLLNNKMRRSPWRHVAMVTAGIIVIYLCVFSGDSGFKIPRGINLSNYEPFEPVASVDFTNGAHGKPIIPKVVHWISQDPYLPSEYIGNIQSFIKLNPDWKFYLWTENASRTLIKESLPELLQLWDDQSHFKHITGRRFIFIKYVVMYLIGGVVLDLSAKNYRSLDTVITKYSCVIPPNPYEEAILTGVPYTVTNRVMLCRSKHPFFKLLIENIHRYQHMSTEYDSVGDGFFMTHYQLYNALQRERDDRNIYIQQNRKDITDTSPYFFQGEFAKTHPDAVYVPNSVYFTGISNPMFHSLYTKTCANFFEEPLLYQRACVHLHRRGMVRKPGKFTYIGLHNNPYTLNVFWMKYVKREIPNIIIYR